MKKWVILAIILILAVVLLAWLYIESTKPLPGEKLLQDGRDHKPEGSKLDFKFNPPTSGDHFASWISKGFYDEPRSDGNIIHSMEHGYVIIWYDCEKEIASESVILNLIQDLYRFSGPKSGMTKVYAQGTNMTQGSEGSASAKLEEMPKAFSDGSCDNFKKDIKGLINKFGPHKLIGMPRVGMDSLIILTAWGRMEKLNSLDSQKIKAFIDAFRDNGPEATNEP